MFAAFSAIALVATFSAGCKSGSALRPAQGNPLEGAQNLGAISVDPNWANYGQYLHRMLEAIQLRWDRNVVEARNYPPHGTAVKVVFEIKMDGTVSRIVSVESTAAKNAVKTCTDAIAARTSYGKWTSEMIETLGESQEITLSFIFQ